MKYVILYCPLILLTITYVTLTDFNEIPKLKNLLISKNIPLNDFISIYNKCSKNGMIHFHDKTNFLFEEPDLCKGRVSIFIAVHSNSPHFTHRQLIRETYGSLNRVGYYTIRLGFFLGQSLNIENQDKINEESSKYHDIIQRDFIESYRNMTRKHLTVMEWISRNCQNADYLVKTDDDIFIDIFHVVREIANGGVNNGFLCSATQKAKPVRSKKEINEKKWFVTYQEYSDKIYPTYCEGFGYIVPIQNFVSRIYICSMFYPLFWIDDVYVTGILAKLLNISVYKFNKGDGFKYIKPLIASHNILDDMFLVSFDSKLDPPLIQKLWRASLKYSMHL